MSATLSNEQLGIDSAEPMDQGIYCRKAPGSLLRVREMQWAGQGSVSAVDLRLRTQKPHKKA